ncbi:MAG TPA: M2 family metallopeptidase [Thermoanaerobaculia bacterium]|jgi:peptidyl-dipeptidase A|nr:M2 family metallopeptidase [Thermoanaerobaculia bacterium]
MKREIRALGLTVILLGGAALALGVDVPAATAATAATATPTATAPVPPTVDEARKFVAEAEERLAQLATDAQRASWVQETYITHDTEILTAQANEKSTAVGVELAKQASRWNGVALPPDLARKLDLLKRNLTLAAPSDPRKTAELAKLAAALDSQYGSGKYCPQGPAGKCLEFSDLEDVMEKSRDPKALLDAWLGWHTISPPMREPYARLVVLANEGARELGYRDTGAMWRSKYDMPPDAFAAELDRLWNQVRPLYVALHCHVRAKLNEKYGSEVVPLDQPIPAHLLGNMWAQEWQGIYDLVAPPNADPGFDLTERLKAKNITPVEMMKYGERFFTSLGFPPLPATFWERSMITKPRDRDVVCHPSAWDIDNQDDLRIKMCTQVKGDDFLTLHHELGHNFYQRAYKQQPYLYEDSANDGFHEAIGDTIALSVTPEYLKKVGLIDTVPDPSKDLGILMHKALEKVAFLPFGLLIDQWRWKVYSGEVKPADYNRAWWELRQKYQGVKPPMARSEKDFDPGAKYHVPANVPYTRYFLAQILEFDFHRGLCKAAGQQGPLNRCSIHGNQAAGQLLARMLEMGQSRPWPEALKTVTGSEQMDATAILDYFAPLRTWLDQQNQGRKCGW